MGEEVDIQEIVRRVREGGESKSKVTALRPRGERGKFLPGAVRERTEVVDTTKWRNFCHEFMRDFNAGRAARAVGYSTSTGKTLMSRPEIRSYINQLTEERRQKYEGELPDVIAELKKMGFANAADYAVVGLDGKVRVKPFELLTEDQKAAIGEMTIESDGTVKYKIAKLEPLVKLGQHAGMFPTRVEFTGKMLIGKIDLTKLSAEEVAKIARDPRVALSTS